MKKESSLEKRERRARLTQKLSELYHEDRIPIRLRRADDFFNPFDGAAEQERELSDEIERYILKELEYKSPKARIAVTFIADDLSPFDIEIMKSAFASHFKRRAEEQIIRNRKSARMWATKLLLALFALAGLLFAAHFFRLHAEGHPFFGVLSESLGIIGWVALWEPAAYFLYGRSEERRILFDFMRLHRATVTITQNTKSE